MKDITHYFQLSATNVTSVSKTTKNSLKEETQEVKTNETSIASPTTPINEVKLKEKNGSCKKRPDTESTEKQQCKKQKLNDSSISKENKNKKTLKGKRKTSSTKDSEEDSTELRKTRKQNKIINVDEEDVTEVSNENFQSNFFQESKILTLKAVELVDCNVPVQKISDDSTNKTESNEKDCKAESDSETVFLETKSKKKIRKNTEKSDDESGSNNLLNYFSKVDRTQLNKNKNSTQTLITVQAIVHSPPKPKTKLKTPTKNVSSHSPVIRSRKPKIKQNFNLDSIEVVATEVVEFDDELKPQNEENSAPSEKSKNSNSSKVEPWKMRVKLTTSSKLSISPNVKATESKTKKNKKPRQNVGSDESDGEKHPKIETVVEEKVNIDDDVEYIGIVEPSVTFNDKPLPVKLAPLFSKKYEKPEIKIRVMDEAKRQFLKSGVPNAIRKKMVEQKIAVEEEYRGEYVFPKYNHVQQKNLGLSVWNLKEITDFKLKPFHDLKLQDILSQSYSFINSNTSLKNEEHSQPFQFDVKNEISALKKQEPNVNVGDMHSTIKRLNKVSENINNVICWSEKYNPTIFEDMVGNKTSLLKLKEWIEDHKRIRITTKEDSDSSDEFIDSDDSCSSVNSKNNVAILCGPNGCGKTSAVYMLANESGFKVLEVNAGSNRTGKRIIDELLEATQSHRVKRTLDSMNGMKKVKKKKKDGKHAKKTMSLILIEDADILFENYDEGFLSALNSLASLSKRPLIFTVNDLNHHHLNKYNNSLNLVLHFDYPSRSSINVWLKLIALAEGVKLTDELLLELFQVAGNDIRKSLLQLQICISSKPYSLNFTGEQIFHHEWLSHITLFGEKKRFDKKKIENESNNKVFSDDEDFPSLQISEDSVDEETSNTVEKQKNIDSLLRNAKFLDSVANLNLFTNNELFETKVHIPHYLDDFSTRLNNDISDFLRERIFCNFKEVKTPISFKKYYNAAMQSSRILSTTQNVFMYFNPKITSNNVRCCEYLPFIRNIARIECNKNPVTFRRANRYFGYLKSVNIDVSDKETELLCSTLM